MGNIFLLLLLQVVLIALNAIFASAEIAVLSINETKLEKMAGEGNGKAKKLFRLTREPAKFLATIQVAITLSGFLGSAFAADNFSDPLVDLIIGLGVNIPRGTLETFALIFITLVLSYFTLVFGELVPKRLAMKKSEKIAMGISGLLGGIAFIFTPIVWFLSASTNVVLRLCGIDPNESEDNVSEDDIRMMVDAGSEKGAIDHQEKEFIQNVFEFNDITAGDVATHRTDVTILWLEDDEEEWEKTIHQSRHTRYPVCSGSSDNVIGVLNAKDYFRLADKTKDSIMQYAVGSAYFVAESIKADVLFKNMKDSHNQIAIVLDEYGGMVGIVSIYDLIEELVGKLNDEKVIQNSDQPHVEQIDGCTWKLHGNVKLDDFTEQTGVSVEGGENETFTGLAFSVLGSVLPDGDNDVTVDIGDLKINITKVLGHQIDSAVVTRITENDDPII